LSRRLRPASAISRSPSATLWDVWGEAGQTRAEVHDRKLTGDSLAKFKQNAGELVAIAPRTRHLLVLTRRGLYRVLMLSRQPKALAFQDWLETEVLPSIEKIGRYTAPGAPVSTTGPTFDPNSAPRRPKQTALAGGPLPVPGPMPNEEKLVVQAKRAGLAAYEALDPAVRRRGLIASCLRILGRAQALWLAERLAKRYGVKPPEFVYGGREEVEHSATFEARAQVWWLVERAPNDSLLEVAQLVDEARRVQDSSGHDALMACVIAGLRMLPDAHLQVLSFALDDLNGRQDAMRAALGLLHRLVKRGPGVVVQAEEWCDRLWQLER
jgi:hypothetical protein